MEKLPVSKEFYLIKFNLSTLTKNSYENMRFKKVLSYLEPEGDTTQGCRKRGRGLIS